MKEIYTSNHMWTLFENFLVDMATVSFRGILHFKGGPWHTAVASVARHEPVIFARGNEMSRHAFYPLSQKSGPQARGPDSV
jgi:hypothetical protein